MTQSLLPLLRSAGTLRAEAGGSESGSSSGSGERKATRAATAKSGKAATGQAKVANISSNLGALTLCSRTAAV